MPQSSLAHAVLDHTAPGGANPLADARLPAARPDEEFELHLSGSPPAARASFAYPEQSTPLSAPSQVDAIKALKELKALSRAELPEVLQKLQPLFDRCGEPSVAMALARALRKEEPPQFAQDEIRAGTLRAFATHETLDLIELIDTLMIEELEERPNGSKAREVAVESLNRRGHSLTTPLSARVVNLLTAEFEREPDSPLIQELVCATSACPDSPFLEQLMKRALSRYTDSEPIGGLFKALTLSRNQHAITLVTKAATGQLHRSINWTAPDGPAFFSMMSVFPGSLVGAVLGGACSDGDLRGVLIGIGIGLFSGFVVAPACSLLHSRKDRRIRNSLGQLEAIKALECALPDRGAEKVLLRILTDQKRPEDQRLAAGKSLARAGNSNSQLEAQLGSDDEVTRHATLLALSKDLAELHLPSIEKCTNDSSKRNRTLAYEILDAHAAKPALRPRLVND